MTQFKVLIPLEDEESVTISVNGKSPTNDETLGQWLDDNEPDFDELVAEKKDRYEIDYDSLNDVPAKYMIR